MKHKQMKYNIKRLQKKEETEKVTSLKPILIFLLTLVEGKFTFMSFIFLPFLDFLLFIC